MYFYGSGERFQSTLCFLPFVLVTALIFLYSTDFFTLSRFSDAVVDGFLAGSVSEDSVVWEYFWFATRKLLHIAAFVVLAFSTFPLRRKRRGACYSFLMCGAVGLASELIQALTVTRIPAVTDVAINLAASLAGLRLLFVPPDVLYRLISGAQQLGSQVRGQFANPFQKEGVALAQDLGWENSRSGPAAAPSHFSEIQSFQ